ncbi:hypothetical protein DPMN_025300 [Dreissena polymorpha]|uniref:Uncharacterized protein n=1 Tax=Dreissena polymorpha TaxID=45954 RepID=A0A9D4RBQ5_DREPO|nr:hypothetical protein DPMN_025300 [Dreissena polymorpha]
MGKGIVETPCHLITTRARGIPGFQGGRHVAPVHVRLVEQVIKHEHVTSLRPMPRDAELTAALGTLKCTF